MGKGKRKREEGKQGMKDGKCSKRKGEGMKCGMDGQSDGWKVVLIDGGTNVFWTDGSGTDRGWDG